MFAGWCRRSGANLPPDPESLPSPPGPYGGGVHHGTWSADDVVLVQSQLAAIPEPEQAPIPAVCRDTGNVLVGWLRLDNRDELLRFLGLDTSDLDSMSDSDLALRGYRAWGTDLAGHLEGEFALAIWSPSRREVYLAATRPGDVRCTGRWIPAASPSAAAWRRCADFPVWTRPPIRIWLARYIVGVPAPFGDHCTAFVGTSRLPPATWALIGPGTGQPGTVLRIRRRLRMGGRARPPLAAGLPRDAGALRRRPPAHHGDPGDGSLRRIGFLHPDRALGEVAPLICAPTCTLPDSSGHPRRPS